MKKIIAVSGILVLSMCSFFAQETDTIQNGVNPIQVADPAKIGVFTAEENLKEVSVDKFESEGTWTVSMSSDEGLIQGRLFDGFPMKRKKIKDEENLNIPDQKVFGVKVSFFRRGYNSFEVKPVKPLPIEGITKTISFWVVGRGYPHKLFVLLEDYFGQKFEVYVGKLNFTGWKLMTVAVPPQSLSGNRGIVQRDYHISNRIGLRFAGFRIDCDPMDAYGRYYMYFDDIRAVTDLYEINHRDPDDMSDDW